MVSRSKKSVNLAGSESLAMSFSSQENNPGPLRSNNMAQVTKVASLLVSARINFSMIRKTKPHLTIPEISTVAGTMVLVALRISITWLRRKVTH